MMEAAAEGREIALDLVVHGKNFGNVNPVCGLFLIDPNSGMLNFLCHTEALKKSPHPKFEKLLHCMYRPGHGQKLQLNIYNASFHEDGTADGNIHEDDRLGSVIIALDKAVPVSALDVQVIAPISIELPLWHDSDAARNERLVSQGASVKVGFKASAVQPAGGLDSGVGPQADQNIHQALAIMLQGAEFLKYPFGSGGPPQKRLVWYERDKKEAAKGVNPIGCIYWNEVGKKKKKKDKCIPLHTITGLFEQGQTSAFRKYRKVLPKERMSRCFSIVGRHRTLDLEAKSRELAEAFLIGIHRILAGSGYGVKEVSTLDKDEMLSAPVIQNTLIIKAKLRNLPPMPWSSDESNDTIIIMAEKQTNARVFKNIDETEWQKGNANPNFSKELMLPFTIPPSNHPVKLNVFDHQLNEKYLMGTSVVRVDFFVKYMGQEMMVKLRNANDARIDALLVEAGAYMLLTATPKQPIPGWGVGPEYTGSSYRSVVDEYKHRTDASAADDASMKPSRLRPFFTRSTLAFMMAGASMTCWDGPSPSCVGPVTVYFRPIEPCGQIIVTNSQSGDVDGMDSSGNPKDPLLTIPMENIVECQLGKADNRFKADTKKQAKENCCMSIVYKPNPNVDDEKNYCSIDLEGKDAGMMSAWHTGIEEYISSVLDGLEGDDDDLFSFIKPGSRRQGSSRRLGKKLGFDMDAAEEEKVGADLAKKFDKQDIEHLGKSFAAESDDEDTDDIDLFGPDAARRRKRAPAKPITPPVMGDGAPPAPPLIVAPDIVLGEGAPPPPPPPGVPGAPAFGMPVYNGPKLKHFHWEVLAPGDMSTAEGTLWSLISDDLEEEASSMLEELFKAADLKALKKKDASAEPAVARVLEGKRAHNIEIVLKSFRMPNAALRDAILQVDTTILTVDKIQALLSMLPVDEEKKALKAYIKSGKPVDKLGNAEQFALHMLEIPRVDTRLRLLLFQAKFDRLVEEMSKNYQRLIDAGKQVHESKPLQKVMETILNVGNKLNAGTRTGGAQAFKLASLDKINDTKSTDNKMTLLDFIVEYVDRHKKTDDERLEEDPDAKMLETNSVPSYLDCIGLVRDAALIDWQALNSDREVLLHGLQELQKEVQTMDAEGAASSSDRFPVAMRAFLEHAMKKAKKMKKRYLDATDLIQDLFEYFGESGNSFEPTDFFKLFERFINNYKQSEIKMYEKRLRIKNEKLRKARLAENGGKKGSGGTSSSSASKTPDDAPVNNLASIMAARRASLEGASKSKDDEWDDDDEKKQASKSTDKDDRKQQAASASAVAAS